MNTNGPYQHPGYGGGDGSHSLASISCFRCGEACKGEVVRVQNVHFHVSCFTCHVCACDLSSSGFFQKGGEYLCTADYQRLYGTRCDGCGDFITGEVVAALGRAYHPECFICSACRNIERPRMPGKKNKKEKWKKAHNRSSPALAGNPSIFLGTLGTATRVESDPGKFWVGPVCSSVVDSAESCRPPTDYESWYKGDQYPVLDFVGSYYSYGDYRESYGEYERMPASDRKTLTSASDRTQKCIGRRIQRWRWRRPSIGIFPRRQIPYRQIPKAKSLRGLKYHLRPRPGGTAPE